MSVSDSSAEARTEQTRGHDSGAAASSVPAASASPAASPAASSATSAVRSSPVGLMVLSMLGAGPLHPYGMQRLIKQWGKDQVVNVGQRANLYKTIRRLNEAGLVAVHQTERDQQYPERTLYELTDEGRAVGLRWLDEMISVPRNEFPEFPAALSFVMLLAPEAAGDALARRLAPMRERLATLDRELASFSATLPRVTILETEYLRAVTAAEVGWLESVLEDLRSGSLTWNREMFEALGEA